ncbi:hypothetical protein SBV1_1530009 [Verrucomicrobia bacterium]|nr:hypothetical protein SBV1_1530009 [Verrucomicrobiota bacterium]
MGAVRAPTNRPLAALFGRGPGGLPALLRGYDSLVIGAAAVRIFSFLTSVPATALRNRWTASLDSVIVRT